MFDWLANPHRFSRLTGNLQLPLIILSTTMISLGLYYGLFDSPKDYQQGDAVRIMYVHVPSAWLASFLYFSLAISCIFYLVWKHPLADLIANAIAPIGLIFSVLTLITGSLWGKPMWGTWWVWDARLTSVAILFIIYLIIIFMNLSFENRIVREKVVAIFILVGSVNLPIVKFSVDWWNTLHQPATISKLSKPSIDPSMMTPLIIMTFAFIMIGIAIAILRIKTEIISRKSYLS